MDKEGFRTALREELRSVPHSARAQWAENDLFLWWLKVHRSNPTLNWERAPGDVWQHVPGMCKGLFGSDSVA